MGHQHAQVGTLVVSGGEGGRHTRNAPPYGARFVSARREGWRINPARHKNASHMGGWMGWVEDTNNAPKWARQRCLVGWKGTEHQQHAHLGTLLVFGGVEGSQTPITRPNGHVVGVRQGGRAPNTNNAPIWARKRCSAGWKGPEHQQCAHLGT